MLQKIFLAKKLEKLEEKLCKMEKSVKNNYKKRKYKDVEARRKRVQLELALT